MPVNICDYHIAAKSKTIQCWEVNTQPTGAVVGRDKRCRESYSVPPEIAPLAPLIQNVYVYSIHIYKHQYSWKWRRRCIQIRVTIYITCKVFSSTMSVPLHGNNIMLFKSNVQPRTNHFDTLEFGYTLDRLYVRVITMLRKF